MAGEWIAMGADLWTAPEVIRLAAFCQQSVSINADNNTQPCQHPVSIMSGRFGARCAALGCLYRIWSIIDIHCDDGILTGYTTKDIDDEVGIAGFCNAMKAVGWLDESPQGLVVPQFEKWFSRSAKRRKLNATYQMESRIKRQQSVSINADKMLTTEQKRTVQKNKKKPPTPLSEIPAELDTPEFRTAWTEWQRHRAEIKEPLTPTSISKQLKQFAEWGPARAISAIEHTIRKGWQGIREDDSRPANGHATDKVGEILKRNANANPK